MARTSNITYQCLLVILVCREPPLNSLASWWEEMRGNLRLGVIIIIFFFFAFWLERENMVACRLDERQLYSQASILR